MGPRAGLDGCGKYRPHSGTRFLGRPACTESLYRLSYRGTQTDTRKNEIEQEFGAAGRRRCVIPDVSVEHNDITFKGHEVFQHHSFISIQGDMKIPLQATMSAKSFLRHPVYFKKTMERISNLYWRPGCNPRALTVGFTVEKIARGVLRLHHYVIAITVSHESN